MIRFFYLISILLLFAINALNARIDIYTDPQGISINLDSLSYKIISDNFGNKSVRLAKSEHTLINAESIWDLDEIRLLLAVPNQTALSLATTERIDTTFNVILSKKQYQDLTNDNLNFKTEIIELGTQRDIRIVMLRIQPYEYSDVRLRAISKLKLRLNFNKPIDKSILNSDNYQLLSFISIDNPEILPYLTTTPDRVTDLQLSSDWYNPNQKYVKISTRNDGIASADVKRILSIAPEFKNKPLKYLHLLYGGKEVPIAISNDSDKLINEGDSIFFYGRRSYGDTTWFDNYSQEATFYLYYNETSEGKRYIPFPASEQPSEEIKSVRIFSHIEKEKTYHRGFPQEKSETAPGEGWWWSVISPSNGWDNSLSDTTIIFPATSTTNADISMKFVSCRWNPGYEYKPLHNLILSINANELSEGSYDFRTIDSLNSIISNDIIIPGLNRITLKTYHVFNDSAQAIEPNEIAVDYYTYLVNSRPFAQNGMANFLISSTNKAFTKIPGFRSKSIFAVDTINGYFGTMTSSSGFFASLSVKSNLSSIVMTKGDNVFSEKKGVHISSFADGSRINKYFISPNSEVTHYLKGLSSNSLIAIAINSTDKSSVDFSNYLKSIGSLKIEQQSGNDNYVCSYHSGKLIAEDYSMNSMVSIFNFKEDSNGLDYQTIFSVPENYTSTVTIADEYQIENSEISEVNNSNLKSMLNEADAIVVYHKNFRESATRYANYRSAANSMKLVLADVDDIYKEFNYGRKSPHAIKKFLMYAYNNWKSPKFNHLILWGDASWDIRKIEKGSVYNDFVPTYGWPGSDYWFSRFDDDFLPDIKVGRVPVKSEEEGMNYIDKLITYDSIPNNPWMKRFLMVSGGQDEKEIATFLDFAKYTYSQDNIADTDLCADTTVIPKNAASSTSESQGFQIQKEINKGVQWYYYMGHGSAKVFDIDGWQVEKLNNNSKYGFLATLACNTAAFPDPSLVSRMEDYLLFKDQGFIGCSGSTGVSFVEPSLNLGLLMLQALSDKNYNPETFVDALWFAKSRLIYNIYDSLTSEHYTYLGDPLIKLKIQRKPDFYFVKNELKISNSEADELITIQDTIRINSYLHNLGPRSYKTIKIRLIHEYHNEKDSSDKLIYGICYPVPFSFSQSVINKPGLHKFKIIVDPDNELGDTKLSNNSISFDKEVFNQGIYPLEPLSNWNMNYRNPVFRVINPLGKSGDFTYKFRIYSTSDTSSSTVFNSINDGTVSISDDFIEWKPDKELLKDKNYWFVSSLVQNDNQIESPSIIIPFHTRENIIDELVNVDFSEPAILNQSTISSNIAYNPNKKGLTLIDEPVSYRVASLYGGTVKNPNRDIEISFGGIKYVLWAPDIVGLKLVVVSGDSLNVKAVRIYQTYYDDSDAEIASRFLKDSVQDNDYILMGTLGESFRGFKVVKFRNPSSIGSLDSLHHILKTYYGSTLADTLDEDLGPYSIIARKNNKDFATNEIISFIRDTAIVEGYLTDFKRTGSVSSYPVGPAKKWNNLVINSIKNPFSSINIQILGLDKLTNNWDVVYDNPLSENFKIVDLSQTKTDKYSYLKLNTSIQRDGEVASSVFNSFSFNFSPTPEFVLSSKSGLIEDTVLRGDQLNLNLEVKNISLRSKSDSSLVRINIYSDSKIIDEFNPKIQSIPLNDLDEIVVVRNTVDFDLKNYLNVTLNPDFQENELYAFNNSGTFNLYLREDEVHPKIRLKLDGKEVINGDFVSRVPFVEVELFDNSAVPITTPSMIGVGINRPFPTQRDTVFETFGTQVPLKARLSFFSDTLDYGENYFRVFASDNAGNKDTLMVKVFVVQNGTIRNIRTYPNPFIENVNLVFNLGMQKNDGEYLLNIYNEIGQKVKEIKGQALIGENHIKWDGYDLNGAIVPSGVYVFNLQIKSSTFFEPVTGRIILIR
jgi:hypothetical protein